MNVVADRLRHRTPQPRWLGWFRVVMGPLMILMFVSAAARPGSVGGARIGLLAVGFVLLGDGAPTLVPTRSPAVAGVLRVVSLVLAAGVLVFFLGRLLGRW